MGSPEQEPELVVDPSELNPTFLSYQLNEVTEVLEGLHYSKHFNPLSSEAEARELLEEGGFSIARDLTLPTTAGKVEFLALHEPIIERITNRNEALFPGLSTFEHRYPTAHGATDGILRLMAGWVGKGEMTRLGIIKGDYHDYVSQAESVGLTKDRIDMAPSLSEAGEPLDGRVWFVSNPSAIDGNWHDQEEWDQFVEAGHKIVLDTAYADLTTKTPDQSVDVSADNIIGLLSTISKPHGLVHQRYPGVVYTREDLKILSNATPYKQVDRLLIALELLEHFQPHQIAQIQKPRQLEICAAIGKVAQGEIIPSDVTLMATAKEQLDPSFDYLRRSNGSYRMRLSTLFYRQDQLRQS